MDIDRSATANGRDPLPWRLQPRTGESLSAQCRRQEVLIDRLSEAVASMHRGAKALKAENADLRAEAGRLRSHRRFPARTARPMQDGELVEVGLPLNLQAPGCARSVVAECVGEQVAAPALDSAQLLVTELVSNSLRHSGSVDGRVVVSVELAVKWFRIGVLDSGSDAVVAVRPANAEAGGGFGLNLVRLLSERWGVEYLAAGGTQVWAQLSRGGGDPAW